MSTRTTQVTEPAWIEDGPTWVLGSILLFRSGSGFRFTHPVVGSPPPRLKASSLLAAQLEATRIVKERLVELLGELPEYA